MRLLTKLAAALFAAILLPCAPASALGPAHASEQARAPVTILVSIDGFRADYLERGVTPVLTSLAAGGVTGPMRPSFPSKTFPNHYALVTGLRPDRNGIVANRMVDPDPPHRVFTMASAEPHWWDEAEPIWVAAERTGIRSAAMFWPGSVVKIRGVRPHDWRKFDHDMPDRDRVDTVIEWLRRPAATRPKLITLYFNTVDDAGHDFGPDAPETTRAVASVDTQIGRLRDALAALGQPANLVVVADHGMAAISAERVIDFAAVADRADWHAIEDGPYASFVAVPGHAAAFERALLGPHAHMQCWRKAEIPARFHYGANPRVPPYLCLADVGWEIRAKPRNPGWKPNRGNHGWDNQAPEMRALFVANGPAFAPGVRLPGFDNVDVYALLRDLVGLPPATGIDGSDAVFGAALRAMDNRN